MSIKPRKMLKGKLKEFAKAEGFKSINQLKAYIEEVEEQEEKRRKTVYKNGNIQSLPRIKQFYGEA